MLILNDIKIKLDLAQLASYMYLTPEMPEYAEFAELLESIRPYAKPVALLDEASILEKTPDKIISSLGEFNCSLLAQLVENSEKIFPFIVSCGTVMDAFGIDISDPLQLYWIDFLKEFAMEQAFKKIKSEVQQICPNEKITSLIPSDDLVWNLEGLKDIFNVFPLGSRNELGLGLTEYLHMQPIKTRAGVFFASHKEVDICELCNIKKCNSCPIKEKSK